MTSKEKATIRYTGFRPANGGGRFFDFAIAVPDFAHLLCSVEIPSELFTGVHRIQLQEGVGIAYAKLKNLFEVNAPMEVPQQVCVTAFDLTQFREVPAPAAKRRSSSEPAKPDFKEIWDRKIS